MITIEDQPYAFTAVGQPLIIVASSDNVGNTGFRYKVTITGTIGAETETVSVYLPPNPQDKLIFDIRPLVENWVTPKIINTAGGLIPIANGLSAYDDTYIYGGNPDLDIKLLEAWQVDGVLTDNVESETVIVGRLFGGYLQHSQGYKPNIETLFGYTSTTSRALSDRVYDTHFFDLSQSWGLGSIQTDRTFIPVREADYGTISAIMEGADAPLTDFTGALKVKISIVPESGSPITWTSEGYGEGRIQHIACYPANLNINVIGMPKPSDYPNWKAILVQFLGAADAVKSMTYVLYNVDAAGTNECKFDNVRLCWLNSRGAWDYMNFTRKNEESIEVERRRYRKVVGTYAADTFGFNAYDRGLTERAPIVQNYLNIESGWLQEGEFTFLKSLLYSKDVYIIGDDATITPVLIEDTSYLVRRARDKKQYNQALKIKYAHTVNV